MKTIITLLLLSINLGFAQITATTEKGEKVLLNDDGTWTYKEKTKTTTPSEKTETECDLYISTEEDRVTGKKSTAAKKSLIVSKDGKNGFSIFLMKSKNSIIMSTNAVGSSGCMDDYPKMNLLFRDGSRLELSANNKFNCQGKHTMYFGGVFGKKKELQELMNKEIEVMRVWKRKGYVEETLTPEQSNELRATIKCLVDYK